MNRITFQPKGSMCMACEHKDALCGSLHFWSMPVIETLMTDDLCNVKIVKCMSFAPAPHLLTDALDAPVVREEHQAAAAWIGGSDSAPANS